MLLNVIALALAIGGIYCIVDMTPDEIYLTVLSAITKESTGIRTLQKQIKKEKPHVWLMCTMADAKKALKLKHAEALWPSVFVAACFMALVGGIIGFISKNYFLIPPLAVIGFEIPFVILKIVGIQTELYLIAELETSLSQITTSYLRNDDFIKAVEENIAYFNSPVKEAFAEFLNRVKNVDADVIKALNELYNYFDVTPFQEWVNTVKSCQRNRKLKNSLPLIVDRLSQTREINNKFRGEVFYPIKEFVVVAAISLVAVPVFAVVKPKMYQDIAVGFIPFFFNGIQYAAIAFSLPSVVNITKPLEFKR